MKIIKSLKLLTTTVSTSKWSSCYLRCPQESGDLAEGNMSSHVVYLPAPIHLPQTKRLLFKDKN